MRFPAVLALGLLLAACGGGSQPTPSTDASGAKPSAPTGPQVTGMVLFDSPVPLTDKAALSVRLFDITRADGEPTEVAAITAPIRRLPAEFALPFDPQQVSPIRSYAVDAQVMDEGTIRFVSMGRVGVLTQGKPNRVNVQLAQALINVVRDPATEMVKEYTEFVRRLGGLKRFADSRIFGPEGKETAIGWDGFADETNVRMVRETISDGEGNNRYTRRFAWKDGKLWFALRDQGGVKIRLGWDKRGALLVKERNGKADDSVAAEAESLGRAAKEAFDIATAHKPD